MERDHHPSAEKDRVPAADGVTSRTVGLPTEQPPTAEQPPTTGPQSISRRLWSERRIPAALTALAVAVAAGTLLVDVIRVRAGQPAAAWRRHLADELASRPLDDTFIQAGGAVLAALGLWLIVLALTPGLRHRLPLKTPGAQMHAVLDRKAAELRMRDAAMRVPGVSAARVRFSRKRATARADVRFRAPADVRADVRTSLLEELDRLALAHRPSLRVRVRPRRP
ncbi:alkaline shock response membrane anchor protein AmaP [Streptomyces yangpuensis]|uniref:Alkaline shock response membrane anchor protein AmaP n=1 Tax=Streptomyces yangpuensis TaxID=1648182 RepID=A0ABY5PQQ5_9ACTN|nr:alkaline shock response membrane anchor protein AmaP [Streptomyces yangpuensis]UUY45933.1 alkaline shock response membrane anchor protein AmaP [Streptomyces yangpuensis]